MCNLYSMTRNQDAIRNLFKVTKDSIGNLPPMPGIFPNKMAPIVRNNAGERELAMVRWGMPSAQNKIFEAAQRRAAKLEAKGKTVDFKALLRMEPDSGTTNIRNLKSKHWTRWTGIEHRCIVPFTSFSEYNADYGGNVWFAIDDSRPLTCFAGLWLPGWTSVRLVKEGETTNDLFGFLTTDVNNFMKPIHGKAMPAILTTPDEVETWMRAPWSEAKELQRPLADDGLRIVAQGPSKYDGAPADEIR